MMYPFFSSSSKNSFSIFVAFEFRGYILQLILVGAPGNNSIAMSSRLFGGNLCASFSLNTFQCFWYSLGSSFVGASSFFSRALCAITYAVVVFCAWIVRPHLWCRSMLRSSGLKVRRAQVDFATSRIAEVFEYSKTDSRVVR